MSGDGGKDGGKPVLLTILYRDHYLTLSIADHSSPVRSGPGNTSPRSRWADPKYALDIPIKCLI